MVLTNSAQRWAAVAFGAAYGAAGLSALASLVPASVPFVPTFGAPITRHGALVIALIASIVASIVALAVYARNSLVVRRYSRGTRIVQPTTLLSSHNLLAPNLSTPPLSALAITTQTTQTTQMMTTEKRCRAPQTTNNAALSASIAAFVCVASIVAYLVALVVDDDAVYSVREANTTVGGLAPFVLGAYLLSVTSFPALIRRLPRPIHVHAIVD